MGGGGEKDEKYMSVTRGIFILIIIMFSCIGHLFILQSLQAGGVGVKKSSALSFIHSPLLRSQHTLGRKHTESLLGSSCSVFTLLMSTTRGAAAQPLSDVYA